MQLLDREARPFELPLRRHRQAHDHRARQKQVPDDPAARAAYELEDSCYCRAARRRTRASLTRTRPAGSTNRPARPRASSQRGPELAHKERCLRRDIGGDARACCDGHVMPGRPCGAAGHGVDQVVLSTPPRSQRLCPTLLVARPPAVTVTTSPPGRRTAAGRGWRDPRPRSPSRRPTAPARRRRCVPSRRCSGRGRAPRFEKAAALAARACRATARARGRRPARPRQSVEVAVVARRDDRAPTAGVTSPPVARAASSDNASIAAKSSLRRSAPKGRAFTRFSSEPARKRLKQASRRAKSACAAVRSPPCTVTSQPIALKDSPGRFRRESRAAALCLGHVALVGRAARERRLAEREPDWSSSAGAVVADRSGSPRGRGRDAAARATRASAAKATIDPVPMTTARRPQTASTCSRRDGWVMPATDAGSS